ncbi:MAG TPA: ankyrin repeat domain-containing protein [Gammaproteobacteria bacterium]|jgi:ankyrin repeat protein|nr:ankyrin repeat domain-containing protein [Gammaproteobacteria bacterium]
MHTKGIQQGRQRVLSAVGGASLAALVALAMAHNASAAAAESVVAAARNGDIDAVKKAIAGGGNVNTPEPDGTSALLWAAYQSSPDLVQMLLKAGADPNAANRFGVTPLLQAARYGDVATMNVLLKGGADIKKAEREGETPLMAAARAGGLAAVKLLLERGADVNARESLQDETALMWATAEGHLDVVDALLKAGANPNLKARVSELTKRSTRTDFPTGGFTAVMWAVRDGNEAIVRRLVEGGADLNIANGDNATPMMLAIINDRFDLAVKLLDMGAGVNDGSLYYAVLMRDATTDWRAKDGSRLRANHDNKNTALDLIRVLLDKGADPNRPFDGQMHSASMCCDTHENGTPFFRAAVAADVEALKLLTARGADLEWKPKKADGGPRDTFGPKLAGKTALMVAMNGGKGVGMAGGPGDIREGTEPPFREVSNRKPVDAVQLLLKAGANPNAKSDEGDTALHLAAFDGKLDIVRALVAGGADLDAKDAAGLTALQVVEKQPPRPPPVTVGAATDYDVHAQPKEVAALLRDLKQGRVQASLAGGR